MSGEEIDRNERFINSQFLNIYVNNTVNRKMQTEEVHILYLRNIQFNIYKRCLNNDQYLQTVNKLPLKPAIYFYRAYRTW